MSEIQLLTLLRVRSWGPQSSRTTKASFILTQHHKAYRKDYIITVSLQSFGLLFSILIYAYFWNTICTLFVELNSSPDLLAPGHSVNLQFLCRVSSAQLFPAVKIYLQCKRYKYLFLPLAPYIAVIYPVVDSAACIFCIVFVSSFFLGIQAWSCVSY